ncbi:MAG: orotidine-5'-phosphate decarboxylase [Chlamydiota bacterium]
MTKQLSYLQRGVLSRHPLAQRLFRIMEDKETNLALAVDVTSQNRLLDLAEELGPSICVLKTHVDLLEDFTPDFSLKIRRIANKHRFLVFEDRKFGDIGQITALQYAKGIYRIAEWADLTNAHLVPGPGQIEALQQIGRSQGRGLLLIAEMSTSGTLATKAYAKKAVDMAKPYSDFVMGFISLGKLTEDPGMIHFTPGVQLKKGKDLLGQRYRTIDEILIKNLSDVIIVGRQILDAPDPKEEASIFCEKAWSAYKMRL